MNIPESKFQFIYDALQNRKEEHQFRSLNGIDASLDTVHIVRNNKQLINFCSNDYLGLATHPEVISRSKTYTEKYGAGATASRLVSGNFTIHEKLEERLAEVLELESVLLFNSGFQANTTVIAALADRNSLILADKKVHNSLLQGAILSRAELRRFRHNDYAHLEELLKKARAGNFNRIWVISETVFSMDGDLNDLDELTRLSEKYGALLYSDDAHALGVLGEHGLGLNFGKQAIDISLGTFGKSFGAFGAFVGCEKSIKEYLINFCSGFIYSTALPPAVIGSVEAALDLIPKMNEKRAALKEKIKKVKSGLHELGFDTGDSNSQIVPVITGSEEATLELSDLLEEKGIWASAIRPPTVESNASRIRLSLTAKHTDTEINQLIRAFGEWSEK